MSYPAGLSAKLSHSSGEAAEEVIRTGALCVEVVRLEDGSALDWQRCPVGDRVFGATRGSLVEYAVAKAENLDIVLESGVTWASERANITDKVLARMRDLDAAAR